MSEVKVRVRLRELGALLTKGETAGIGTDENGLTYAVTLELDSHDLKTTITRALQKHEQSHRAKGNDDPENWSEGWRELLARITTITRIENYAYASLDEFRKLIDVITSAIPEKYHDGFSIESTPEHYTSKIRKYATPVPGSTAWFAYVCTNADRIPVEYDGLKAWSPQTQVGREGQRCTKVLRDLNDEDARQCIELWRLMRYVPCVVEFDLSQANAEAHEAAMEDVKSKLLSVAKKAAARNEARLRLSRAGLISVSLAEGVTVNYTPFEGMTLKEFESFEGDLLNAGVDIDQVARLRRIITEGAVKRLRGVSVESFVIDEVEGWPLDHVKRLSAAIDLISKPPSDISIPPPIPSGLEGLPIHFTDPAKDKKR